MLAQRASNVSVNDYYYILFYYVSGELRSQVRVTDTVETEIPYPFQHPLWGSVEQTIAILNNLARFLLLKEGFPWRIA